MGLKLRDILPGDLGAVLVSNYMIDMPWLLSAIPALACAAPLVIVHGERQASWCGVPLSVKVRPLLSRLYLAML